MREREGRIARPSLLGATALLAALVLVVALAPGASGEQAASNARRLQAGLIDVGDRHTCALLDNGKVRCWGYGGNGRLGYGNSNNIGDDEVPGSAGPVKLGAGRRAVAISAGDAHSCALLDNGGVRCWGHGLYGRLGYGNAATIGDDETPGGFGPVSLGGKLSGAVGDLSLTVRASRGRARVGQRLVLVSRLRNSGPDPTPAVLVRLTVPRKLRMLSAGPGKGTYNRKRGNWKVGKLAAGKTARLKLTVSVRSKGRIVGLAAVKASGSPDPDSTPGNGAASEDDSARFRIKGLR